MTKSFATKLANARKSAGLTQEQASELLDVVTRTLGGYENGANVPDDIIAKMIRLYNTPELGYEWLRQTKTGSLILPELESKSLPENILTLLASLSHVKSCTHDLINIGQDGIVDKNEQALFKNIIEKIKPTIKAMFSLKFHKNKKAEPSKERFSIY